MPYKVGEVVRVCLDSSTVDVKILSVTGVSVDMGLGTIYWGYVEKSQNRSWRQGTVVVFYSSQIVMAIDQNVGIDWGTENSETVVCSSKESDILPQLLRDCVNIVEASRTVVKEKDELVLDLDQGDALFSLNLAINRLANALRKAGWKS